MRSKLFGPCRLVERRPVAGVQLTWQFIIFAETQLAHMPTFCV